MLMNEVNVKLMMVIELDNLVKILVLEIIIVENLVRVLILLFFIFLVFLDEVRMEDVCVLVVCLNFRDVCSFECIFEL